MSNRRTDRRKLARLLRPIGYEIAPGRKHYKIIDGDGHRIYSFASTPSDAYWYENTIKDLVKMGVLPISERHKL